MGDLTKNFSEREFACHCCGQVKVDMQMVNLLQLLRDIVGPISPDSGYRCPKHNKAVNGAKNSYHMKGMAVDVPVAKLGLTPPQLAQLAEKVGFTGIGLYDTFVHCDTRPVKTKFNKSTKWEFIEPKAKYYKKGNTYIIETTPDNLYTILIGETLDHMNLNGINGTFFDVNKPSNINSVWGVAVNNGAVIGVGVPWVGARATIIYTTDGKLELKYIKDITKEYDTSKIKWAISGGGLLQNGKDVYNPKNENFRDDVTRKCNHSGIGFANGKVFLFVKEHTWYDPCPLSRLVKTAQNLGLTDAIFFDGGGSSQINYKGQGLKSTRKISTAILLKEE